ncbi:MAG: hypothetical protein ACTHLE_03530 [Agriterribacter sp.]
MKILYTLPGIETPHGGYRIVMEHLTRLQKLGHDVALFIEKGKPVCPWYDHNITITLDRKSYKHYDIIVIGSPHSIWMQDYIKPGQKCFLFMQMVEEKFRPNDALWARQCKQFYLSRFPIIHGSKWGEEHCRKLGRTGEMHYVGNGVNFDHFPISKKPKDGKVVLLEGCFNKNPAKDVDGLAFQVALMLKNRGYKIIGYGFDNPTGVTLALDEYTCKPSLSQMNVMYEDATILLKATKYDARALSPMEAATKGTLTVRSIIEGDDDLTGGFNCIRIPYLPGVNDLFYAASNIFAEDELRERLANNARSYVQQHCNWDTIILQLEKILLS